MQWQLGEWWLSNVQLKHLCDLYHKHSPTPADSDEISIPARRP